MEEADRNKHKGGRPKKGITQRKQRVVSIRFSEAEYYAIKRRASLAGMTVSTYSHSAIMDGKVVEPVKKEDMDLLRKLSGEANNLNQIAHQANTYRMPYLEKEVKNVLNLVTEIINRLSDDWKNNKGKKL
ncbi:mobilization protein [Bacteroidia bacterium]|nr:mobilization protein [Bacteroidia bacterium]